MKVTRRQFLKISSGAIGTVAAAEAVGLGADTTAVKEHAQTVPIKTGKQVPSICPYCAVGCGQIVTVDDKGKIIDIQGHPDSPINQGTLCPKGAATYQLVNNDLRMDQGEIPRAGQRSLGGEAAGLGHGPDSGTHEENTR